MKTPRAILFARHQAAAPKLAALRREVVAGLNHQDAKPPSGATSRLSWCLGGSNKLWQELILPSRRIWSGLAAVWLLLGFFHCAQPNSLRRDSVTSSASLQTMTTIRDQQRLLNELLADRALPAEADVPKIIRLRPQSKITGAFTT